MASLKSPCGRTYLASASASWIGSPLHTASKVLDAGGAPAAAAQPAPAREAESSAKPAEPASSTLTAEPAAGAEQAEKWSASQHD